MFGGLRNQGAHERENIQCRQIPHRRSSSGSEDRVDTMGSDIHGAEPAAGRINQIFIMLVIVIKTSHLLSER